MAHAAYSLVTTRSYRYSQIMIFLLLLLGGVTAQRGHYIVDYQRLPLYQEFYLSPGLYRPLFPGKTEAGRHEARRIDAPLARHHKHQAVGLQAVPAAALQPQVVNATGPHQQDLARPVEDNKLPASEPVVAAQEQHQPQDQAVVVTAHEQDPEHVPPVLTYSNSMTNDGSYSYKYETADGLMREESSVMEPTGEDGRMVPTVRGSYSYPGPDGRTIRVDYVADGGGFRATGDHLPQTLQDTVYNFKYVIP